MQSAKTNCESFNYTLNASSWKKVRKREILPIWGQLQRSFVRNCSILAFKFSIRSENKNTDTVWAAWLLRSTYQSWTDLAITTSKSPQVFLEDFSSKTMVSEKEKIENLQKNARYECSNEVRWATAQKLFHFCALAFKFNGCPINLISSLQYRMGKVELRAFSAACKVQIHSSLSLPSNVWLCV